MNMSKIHVSTGAVISDVDSTKLYLNEIKQAKLLTQEEERSLANRIKDGDQSAVNELVSSNLRFVVQVAKQYQGMGVELEDLIGFGNLGLFEAAKRFEADRGIKFISFAVWYVRAVSGPMVELISSKWPSPRLRSSRSGDESKRAGLQ